MANLDTAADPHQNFWQAGLANLLRSGRHRHLHPVRYRAGKSYIATSALGDQWHEAVARRNRERRLGATLYDLDRSPNIGDSVQSAINYCCDVTKRVRHTPFMQDFMKMAVTHD